MNPIKIPVTISPHIVNGKPRGYYIIAERLFTKSNPHLIRKQFLGIARGLIISVGRDIHWDSLLKMSIHIPEVIYTIGGCGINKILWLSPTKIYPFNMGFRAYIPGTVLKPESAEAKKIQTMGFFKRFQIGTTDLLYLEVPLITPDIMLGKTKLD